MSTRLSYPLYFMTILGVWKIVGTLVIIVPGLPRLKELAYAGIFFDVTGAAASHASAGDYGACTWHVLINLLFTALVIASWAPRPQSRALGDLFPARKNTRAGESVPI